MIKPKRYKVGSLVLYINRNKQTHDQLWNDDPAHIQFFKKLGKKYFPISLKIPERVFFYIVEEYFGYEFQYSISKRFRRVKDDKKITKYIYGMSLQELELHTLSANLRRINHE